MTTAEKFLLINYLSCIELMIDELQEGTLSKEYAHEHIKDLIKDSKALIH